MKNPFKGVSDNNENDVNIGENTEEDKLPENNTEVISEEADAEASENNEEEERNPLQEKYEQLNNQYIRLAADFENYRKRQEQEKEALLKYGAENTLKKIIEL